MSLLKRLIRKDKSSLEEKSVDVPAKPDRKMVNRSQDRLAVSRAALPPLEEEGTIHSDRIIIGIPGPWESEQDVLKSMIESGESNFIFLGPACCETRTKEVCEVAIEGFNPNLTDLFEYYAEPFNISQETLELIQRHKQCVYLIFDSPSLDKARTATRFANAFLRLGGMAIMIRSAGIIHDRRTWFETVETLTDDGLYFLFVNLLSSKEQYHSCGMQNFGLPDAEVSSVDRQDAARILNEFNLYRLAGCRSNSGPGSHARRSALKQAKTAAWEPPLLTCPTDC